MKRTQIIIIAFVSAISLLAQNKFNPEKFKAELHQYIVTSANLTEKESTKLLPIYDEMISKQRTLHKQLRKLQSSTPQNNKSAKNTILEIDDFRSIILITSFSPASLVTLCLSWFDAHREEIENFAGETSPE